MADDAKSVSSDQQTAILAVGRDGNRYNVSATSPFTEEARRRVEGILKERRCVLYAVLDNAGQPTGWFDVPLGFAGPYCEPQDVLPAPVEVGTRADAENEGRRHLRNALKVLWQAGFAFGGDLDGIVESESARLHRVWRETDVDPGLQELELGVRGAAVVIDSAAKTAGRQAAKKISDGLAQRLREYAQVSHGSTRLPHVVIRNADELRLASGEATVVTGGPDSALLIDGIKYAISNEDPVVIRPHGPGIDGGTITLTLICDSILGENETEQEAPDA